MMWTNLNSTKTAWPKATFKALVTCTKKGGWPVLNGAVGLCVVRVRGEEWMCLALPLRFLMAISRAISKWNVPWYMRISVLGSICKDNKVARADDVWVMLSCGAFMPHWLLVRCEYWLLTAASRGCACRMLTQNYTPITSFPKFTWTALTGSLRRIWWG